jgi:hypothetical protein
MSRSSTESVGRQRRERRIELDKPPNIRDANSGSLIGQLANVSRNGLMVVGPCSIAPGTVLQLHIALKINGELQDLLVGAENLWCHDANETGAYWSGFQIIDISPGHRQLLDVILND